MGLYVFNSPISAHVISIIKLEVSTLPIVIIFFRGCVPEMSVTSYSVTYCIYIPGKPGFCFHYHCVVYDEIKYSDAFWLADRIRLFAHNIISLSSLCIIELIKCLSDIFCRVCEWDYVYCLSCPLYNILGCVFSVYPSPLWWCLVIIIKSEVWTITHCLGGV